MFKALMPTAASLLLVLGTSGASAQATRTFRFVSQASGKCLSLKAADQSDGGGLRTAPCQKFADFFVTVAGSTGEVQLQFQLNSQKFVCIFATETPVLDPSGRRAKVGTRNCVGPPVPTPSLWNIRGPDNAGFQQIEKLNHVDSTNFCMRENAQTSDIELDVCQGVPEENWKLESVP
jgi:hypothetical protein